jgi:hypothetical protein
MTIENPSLRPEAPKFIRAVQNGLMSLLLRLDDERLRQHFRRTERELRGRDVRAWPAAVQRARARALDHLHEYVARGVFPRNHERRHHYQPCFIDRDERACAVAYLLIQSGQEPLARKVAADFNFARIADMTAPELDDWAAQAGFTRAELARIQPGYPSPLDPIIEPTCRAMLIMVAAIGIGAVMVIWDAIHRPPHPGRSWVLGIGLWIVTASLLAVYWFARQVEAATPGLNASIYMALAHLMAMYCAPIGLFVGAVSLLLWSARRSTERTRLTSQMDRNETS